MTDINKIRKYIKKRVLITLGLVAMLVGHAHGQTTDETLEELFDVMTMDETVDVLFEQMQNMMSNVSGAPTRTAEEQEIEDQYQASFLALLKKEIAADSMKQDLLQIYKQNYTDKELKYMLAYYKSPTGRSILAKEAIVTEEAMKVSQQMVMDMMPKINKLIEEKSRKLKELKANV